MVVLGSLAVGDRQRHATDFSPVLFILLIYRDD